MEPLAWPSARNFGALGDGFIRCSYAASVENIQKAVERIAAFVRGE